LVLAAALLPTATAGHAGAQEPPRRGAAERRDAEEVVRVTTDLVSLTAAIDENSKAARSARALERLRVFADGRPQQIAFASADDPAAVALLVDTSTSMGGRKAARTLRAVGDFISNSDERNTYALIVFTSEVREVGRYAGDGAGRRALLKDLEAEQRRGGETALYDACLRAGEIIAPAAAADPRRKRALVVFTDGLDTRSRSTPEALARGLDELGGLVYVIVLGGGVGNYEWSKLSDSDPHLDETAAGLRRVIAGEVFEAPSGFSLLSETERAARGLRGSVQLGFYVRPPDSAALPGTHRLLVTDARGRPLRSRPSYVIN
jgi:Mg-chelatase subunit ChlD